MKSTLLPDNILKRMRPADRAKMGKAGMTTEEADAAFTARSERELQAKINGLLNRHEQDGKLVYNWSRTDKRTTCRVGWPDYTIFANGKVLLWEVKFGNGRVSIDQSAMNGRLYMQGFPPQIIRSYQEALASLGEFLK